MKLFDLNLPQGVEEAYAPELISLSIGDDDQVIQMRKDAINPDAEERRSLDKDKKPGDDDSDNDKDRKPDLDSIKKQIEDAKKQGTKNLDKFPKNMLYARAMSNGQKWFCPDVFQMAVYVPEEMQAITEDVTYEPVEEQPLQIEVSKPIKLSQVAIDKLVTEEEIEKYLNLVEEGKVTMTQVQVLNLEDKLTELRKNG